jgi:RNA polymerase sigma factor (sigma-70 family)
VRTDETDSVTGWIKGLGTSRHEDALQLLWDRYFERLARLTRERLRGNAGGPVGCDDVALDALDSFFRGAAAGRFDRLEGRDDLWRLLVAIASRKASNAVRDERRLKRGGSVDFGDSRELDAFAARDPSPEVAALLADETRRLFESLSDDSLRQVARLRLEGYSNEEIADTLDCGLRTVERKLAVVRKRWTTEGGL